MVQTISIAKFLAFAKQNWLQILWERHVVETINSSFPFSVEVCPMADLRQSTYRHRLTVYNVNSKQYSFREDNMAFLIEKNFHVYWRGAVGYTSYWRELLVCKKSIDKTAIKGCKTAWRGRHVHQSSVSKNLFWSETEQWGSWVIRDRFGGGYSE